MSFQTETLRNYSVKEMNAKSVKIQKQAGLEAGTSYMETAHGTASKQSVRHKTVHTDIKRETKGSILIFT